MQKRILLVDDESSIRKSLSLGLSQEGIEVEPCESGIDALKKLELYKQNNVDLSSIILDIKLPDIDGIKLGKIIKSKYPEISLIYITGYADTYNVKDIEELNNTAIIEKPFTSDELSKKINELVKDQNIEEKVEDKTLSIYALIKVKKDANFFDVYREMYFSDKTVYCDTTKGEYDIIMLLQAGNDEKIEELKNNLKDNQNIAEITFLNVKKPILEDSINDFINIAETLNQNSETINRDFSRKVCSYILLEVEKESVEKVYPVLKLDDQVVFCDYTSGKYNLVLFVQGSFYSAIDSFIEDKLSNLPGVLKIKEFPVVNMFDM
ncbi:MAG: hypothetical protein Kow0068_19200 [Marinilabiliales bacterium]